ncbi:ParB/RepB/Spo0J family partition protein (plasmid) [Alteromonas macleodii]|uniref:ParB/RepB/Spo0J family partition protein n=1 Tax=Alteromonas macleodii TaxID=28108 RepID=UPI0030CEAF4A
MSFDIDEAVSFDSMLDDSEGQEGAKKLKVSSIRRYPHNRVLTKSDVQPLISELEESNWELIHPIVVRPINDPDHDYELVAGERRWTAFSLSGKDEIEAKVRDDLDDSEVAAINISENIHAMPDKLHFLALKIKRYIEEFKVKKGVAAKRFGLDSAHLSRLINYLYRINDIPEIAAYYDDGKGVVDSHLLTAMVKIYNVSPSALRDAIGFAENNNCMNRKFFEAVTKMSFEDDLESQMQEFKFGLAPSKEPSTQPITPKEPKPEEEQGELSGLDDSASEGEEKDAAPNIDVDYDDEEKVGELADKQRNEPETLVVGEVKVTKRPVSQADIAMKVEGEDSTYFLAKNFRCEEEGKVVLQTFSGELKVFDINLVKIVSIM